MQAHKKVVSWGGSAPQTITFFWNFAHSFIHQTLDQQYRDPTKYVQNLGENQTKQSADPGPYLGYNELTLVHKRLQEQGMKATLSGLECSDNISFISLKMTPRTITFEIICNFAI